MKVLILVLIQILNFQFSNGQSLQLSSNIEQGGEIFLKGEIDSTYKISMELNIGGVCGFEEYASQWRNREIYGWYYYDNIKAKIPLIGYFNGSDGFKNRNSGDIYKYLELFVPHNYLTDTIDKSSCFPDNYSERFYNRNNFNFNSMIWNKNGQELPVRMEIIHNRNLESEAELILSFLGKELTRINISELTTLKYIEGLDPVDVKDFNDRIHLTFTFHERTIPGGSGGGQCGAGIEQFIGYLKLRKDWKVEKFEYKQVHSCCCLSKVEKYKIEKGKPEMGLIKIDDKN
jgi:hypothetical protein